MRPAQCGSPAVVATGLPESRVRHWTVYLRIMTMHALRFRSGGRSTQNHMCGAEIFEANVLRPPYSELSFGS